MTPMPVSATDVRAVQSYYPRIYLACHTRHVRRGSTSSNLTEAESGLLGHLHERLPVRASTLARHLGVSKSALSASIKRLTALGYVTREPDDRDARAVALRLSVQGARAMQAGSVLDTRRVHLMLAQLTPADRRRAVDGLALLARASSEMPRKKWRER
jgi:DNA-binding MarR family transcriptional regulator